MINQIYTFDDIITIEEQEQMLHFVTTTDLVWTFEKNITGHYGGKQDKYYPANVLPKIKLKNHFIDSLINKIQVNATNKLNLNFIENYRYKINWTKPLDFTYNPIDLLHVDSHLQHIAMVYYVNNSTGDTHIYDNKEGNNVEVYQKYSNNNINYSNLKLIEKVSPKMGRVVIFDGGLHHHAEYPQSGDRFIINFNFVAKEKNKSLI